MVLNHYRRVEQILETQNDYCCSCIVIILSHLYVLYLKKLGENYWVQKKQQEQQHNKRLCRPGTAIRPDDTNNDFRSSTVQYCIIIKWMRNFNKLPRVDTVLYEFIIVVNKEKTIVCAFFTLWLVFVRLKINLTG